MSRFDAVLVWFRRDLRDVDHTALAEALRRGRRVYCLFVFDRDILDELPRRDRRVEFIRESLVELDEALRRRGGGLIVRHARAVEAVPAEARALGVDAVFANRDYEPAAKARDATVAAALQEMGIGFESFKDQAIFDGPEVLTQAGRPYTVFTPYKNAWLKRLGEEDVQAADSHVSYGTEEISVLPVDPPPPAGIAGSLRRQAKSYARDTGHRGLAYGADLPAFPAAGDLAAEPATGVPALVKLGFEPTDLHELGIAPGMSGAVRLLEDFALRLPRYREQRDYPAVKGVSYLSVHLRFGTVSIRAAVRAALAAGARHGEEGPATWLSELIWRDFYFMILDAFPHAAGSAFRPEYDRIRWEEGAQAEAHFAAWCEGRTGYPLVDAAMRQLNSSGYMHNRLRMVVASFLTKDLGIDWRRGEAYFAQRLNDFDLAANNGGWQWAASSGCDAQPWFRIFNPVTQSERFDPQGRFIRRYLPELARVPDRYLHAPWTMSAAQQTACGVIVGRDTPAPLVAHDEARLRTLDRYAVVRQA